MASAYGAGFSRSIDDLLRVPFFSRNASNASRAANFYSKESEMIVVAGASGRTGHRGLP